MNRKPFLALLLVIITGATLAQKKNDNVYVCLPCGADCDAQELTGPGQCEHCHMPLVAKSTIRHKTVSPDKVCDFVSAHPGILLLDVRTKPEFDGTSDPNFGALKNAINIPVQELESRLDELTAYKNKTVLVYCSHSHRSPRASYLLTQNGFKDVVNMEGGMSVMTAGKCRR